MTQTFEKPAAETSEPAQNLPMIAPPRLPYHPAIEKKFGIDSTGWRTLVEAIFPNAKTTEGVILAMSYCASRKLDVFKRPVHIVPIWNKQLGREVESIWPGIGELRTTAFRTGQYCGKENTEFGPDVTEKVGAKEMTYPSWARVCVHRMVDEQRVAFHGPQVWWIETYANFKRGEDTPNDMWSNRPRGQLEKCAEAAALRAAFPEEIGSDPIGDEIPYDTRSVPTGSVRRRQNAAELQDRLATEPEPTLDTTDSQLTQTTDDNPPPVSAPGGSRPPPDSHSTETGDQNDADPDVYPAGCTLEQIKAHAVRHAPTSLEKPEDAADKLAGQLKLMHKVPWERLAISTQANIWDQVTTGAFFTKSRLTPAG